MKARDLMAPLSEHLLPDMQLKEAAIILKLASRIEDQHGAKGLPVLNADGEMIGFLSIGDVLKAVYPLYLDSMELENFTWDGMVERLAKEVSGKPVFEVMTEKVITVKSDAPLMACVAEMMKHGVKRLPVIGGDGKVAGIVYEKDVFLAITDAMLRTGE